MSSLSTDRWSAAWCEGIRGPLLSRNDNAVLALILNSSRTVLSPEGKSGRGDTSMVSGTVHGGTSSRNKIGMDLMDCKQVKELLDAYALGAADPEEAAALEEHMDDCARCWKTFNEAQRAAAAVALSTSLHPAPESLRRNILAEIERTRDRS